MGNVYTKDHAHETTGGKEDSTVHWTRGHLCYVLAKNYLFTFSPCPETLWEAEFKGDRIINLTEEISRQFSVQVVSPLLLAAFSQGDFVCVCVVLGLDLRVFNQAYFCEGFFKIGSLRTICLDWL
jgi:hypothetical protein